MGHKKGAKKVGIRKRAAREEAAARQAGEAAGDLVFGGTADGFFFALDAETGEELWHKSVGGRVHAAPMAYAVDGKQYVAIAAGNAVFSFALPD